ncbi:MAG: hypothetical protein WC498_00325 [Candidatus Saccharimonadales bacterium]
MRPSQLKHNFVRRLQMALFGAGLLLVPALAAAQTVTQSYTAVGNLQNGMIVMLDSKDTTKVRPLTSDNASAMQGVVVAANDSAVTLTGDGSSNQVYVATNGKYKALVSNQNGTIKSGDYITISSLDGVGMRADSGQSVILGKALEGFDGTTGVSSTVNLATTTGGTRQVSIGLIQVDIGIAHNPLQASSVSNVPGFLSKASQAIVDKPVSAPRLYVSLVVLVLTVFIVGSFLYGGVRSGVTAIGRNPLARQSITKGLVQVILLGSIIFVIGLFAVYLILKL